MIQKRLVKVFQKGYNKSIEKQVKNKTEKKGNDQYMLNTIIFQLEMAIKVQEIHKGVAEKQSPTMGSEYGKGFTDGRAEQATIAIKDLQDILTYIKRNGIE